MPYIYAVEVLETLEDGKRRRVHKPAPKEIAENHENGYWALVAKDNSLRGLWFQFNPRAEESLKYAEPDATGRDAVGQELRARDYVMTTIDKSADLSLCEVVSFTNQQVRIRPFNGSSRLNGYDTCLKHPSMIVRIDENLF